MSSRDPCPSFARQGVRGNVALPRLTVGEEAGFLGKVHARSPARLAGKRSRRYRGERGRRGRVNTGLRTAVSPCSSPDSICFRLVGGKRALAYLHGNLAPKLC